MSNSLVPIDPQLLVLIHEAFDIDGKLKTFAREIMLVECHVAGTSFRDSADIEPELEEGCFLLLRRERSLLPGYPRHRKVRGTIKGKRTGNRRPR